MEKYEQDSTKVIFSLGILEIKRNNFSSWILEIIPLNLFANQGKPETNKGN